MRRIDGPEADIHRIFLALEGDTTLLGLPTAIVLIKGLRQCTLATKALFLSAGSFLIKATGGVSIRQVQDNGIEALQLELAAEF